MDIKYIVGDATYPVGDGKKVIMHVVNDLGKWGSGFVLALSKRWKLPEEEYKKWFRLFQSESLLQLDFHLGNVQMVKVEDDIIVANMLAQHQLKFNYSKGSNEIPLQYGSLELCLKKVASFCRDNKCSVHCPKIGSGRAMGDWRLIEILIKRHLTEKGIPVTVYTIE